MYRNWYGMTSWEYLMTLKLLTGDYSYHPHYIALNFV